MPLMSDFIVCSFHTDDEYYRRHGEELKKSLSDLGVTYVVEEIAKKPGQDWADLCRQKVPFLKRICDENPDSKVFWIDVDCRLISLPDFVRNSTADIIGFQRGFSNPRTIGYHKRGRFWEPCFWGVNTTAEARRMITDAAAFEATSDVKATDDYFFEEGWRANAAELTFQIIPSTCVVGKGGALTERQAFFLFGSSGNVDEFKDKVAQHASDGIAIPRRALRARQFVVRSGKKALEKMPPDLRRKALALADKSGVTGLLVPGPAGTGVSTKQRNLLIRKALRAGMEGDTEGLDAAANGLLSKGVPTREEQSTLDAARSFAAYSTRPGEEKVDLVWWARPFPGNYGDWLSPLVVGHYTDRRLVYQPPTASSLTSGRHLVGVGSIGRFVKPNSVVVGTGISSDEYQLDSRAEYVSLRGPMSAEHLKACGGPTVESFGDPAAVLSRIIPVERGATNGRTAFVRHHKHRNLPVVLPEGYDELEVLVSHPDAIRELVTKLAQYDQVVTSAMHIMITCQSYGIPCALIVFEGYLDAVAGNGMKYTDYALGVGLDPITPAPVPLDLRSTDLQSLVMDLTISETKKDEVEDALRRAVAAVTK
jgi:Polysaccharide pyruvyl transferase